MKIKINNKGMSIVLLAIGLLVVIVAFAGLAVDVSRAYKVRGELQNCADAAALSGAMKLYSSSTTFDITAGNRAVNRATADIQLNKSEGADIVNYTVNYGTWDLSTTPGTFTPNNTGLSRVCSVSGAICTSDSDCPSTQTCNAKNLAAVSVSVKRSVPALFARVVGWTDFTPGTTAVAVEGFPGALPPGEAFPFVISKCFVQDFINGTGISSDMELTSIYHTSQGDMQAGQWSNLEPSKDPSASLLKGYLDYMIDPTQGSPSPAVQSQTTPIYIDPGTKDVVYQRTQDLINAGKGLVYLPVVDCNITANSSMVIRGFVAIQLTQADNPKFTIFGHFVNFYPIAPGSSPGGSPSNVLSTKLVK